MRCKDISGQQFRYLLAVSPTDSNKQQYWLTRCLVCGREDVKIYKERRQWGCMSCQGQARSEVGFNRLFARYKRRAVEIGQDFMLTREEFREITSSPCCYCGTGPKMVSSPRWDRRVKNGYKCGHWTEYLYNGVDRQDNSQGYTLENCVPCCKNCNLMKHTRSSEEFVAHVQKVYEFQNTPRHSIEELCPEDRLPDPVDDEEEMEDDPLQTGDQDYQESGPW